VRQECACILAGTGRVLKEVSSMSFHGRAQEGGLADKDLLFEPCGHRITVGPGMKGIQLIMIPADLSGAL
jgi:hypothetical protein